MIKKEKIEKGIEFYANRKTLMFARWLSVNFERLPIGHVNVTDWYYEKLKYYNEKVLPNEEHIINMYNDFLIKKMNNEN